MSVKFEFDVRVDSKKLYHQKLFLMQKLQSYFKKQFFSNQDQEKILSAICSCIVSSTQSTCDLLVENLGSFLVDFLYRIAPNCHYEKLNDLDNVLKHEQMCICLVHFNVHLPCLSEFILNYLQKCGPPFIRLSLLKKKSENVAKRRKKMIPRWYNEVLKSTYLLLKSFPSILSFSWSWSDLIECFSSNDLIENKEALWYLKQILAHVFGLNTSFDDLTDVEEKILYDLDVVQGNRILEVVYESSRIELFQPKQFDQPGDFSKQLCMVSGVLLHRKDFLSKTIKESSENFVETESLKSQLQSFALAVSEGKGVLLEGPVGCGKTALVEYLAAVTGHSNPPFLSKVQLSDDTDSKTLTGTYICSSVPGQFLWQPGLLVQACKQGYWVLLEDIDMAPMDVISLILPIIESGQFIIPGHYNKNIVVSSGFRLIMTRRNTTSNTLTSSASVNMLLKHTKTIKLEEISEDDLRKIIVSKYPDLSTVVDKLLTIYQNLKAHKSIQKAVSFLRKPSTRDLLKWCSRVSHHIATHGSEGINLVVAMSAMDCFVASCPHPEIRLRMTEIITVELNIGGDKAEYYCNTYKPEVKQNEKSFQVGRSSIDKIISTSIDFHKATRQLFAFTRHSSVLLERISNCVEACEPVLLVGETGVGKTSALQYLAQETGRKLHVINMSQQSSSSDLLGGYKPAQLCHLMAPVREEFERIFPETFSQKQNLKFLTHVQTCFANRRYNDLWQLMVHSSKAAIKMLKNEKKLNRTLLNSWQQLLTELNQLRLKLKSDSPIAFNFIAGKLSQCIERGDWLLLDEINLAASDTLECLSCVLESESGSIVLMERGDAKPLARHKDFRLFAAMNPATDVGKRNLPEGVQNRFTEIFVDEPTNYNDIATIVAYYLNKRTVTALSAVDGIVQFYLEVRKLSDKLTDGTGRKPHYSLRTLCRALRYVVDNSHVSIAKAFYEGFCLSFLTALDRSSHPIVVNLITQHIVGKKNLKSVIEQTMPKPDYSSVCTQGHHIRSGPLKHYSIPHYILTPSVKRNLKDLARPVSYGKYPILIQGETSTGKTSLIKYLASITGNKVIRINNHEHTDLQEYVGYYASDQTGKLVFQDGPLVTAMKEGHWVILDELNLAPTDILEALNRVLDDNRELFVTETQEVVRAHPSFTLFATQNPPGLYGGRKILSRAFRNRFVELHFDEIPTDELEIILHKRCGLAPTHCKKLIKVMLDLQARRKASGLFSGKHGFMTLRDLFRWAERHRRVKVPRDVFYDWEQHLVDDGYLLLAGKVRRVEEEKVIESVLKKHFKRTVNHDKLFGLENVTTLIGEMPSDFDHVVWTQPMRRLYVTLERALRFDEPVLLVGETGGGKTTACQLISRIMKRKLSIINCHANTEAADFIGGLRPSRHRDKNMNDEDESGQDRTVRLFEWVDGPLVQSMMEGRHILIDEISLADDSVLERLNSVLEPERILVIPDKATVSDNDITTNPSSFVTARKGFQFLATMNPGGDYGKKELSPALRNRMTEIWCDVIHVEEDLTSIVQHNLHLPSAATFSTLECAKEAYARMAVEFVTWFKSTIFGKRFVISVRDLITWSNFMSITSNHVDLPSSYIHAACLVYIDGLGSGLSGAFAARSAHAHAECLKFVVKQLKKWKQYRPMNKQTKKWVESEIDGQSDAGECATSSDGQFGIKPFSIKCGPELPLPSSDFSFGAHTTSINALRVMRALQLPRPILLEGSPGGGKTSLVAAIAKSARYNLVRINLSEQTDASDLFGADLPLENGKGGEFSWRDGPLLAAMKAGHWVVLDELNLASQSVLECLNSVFDHRGELYVPELDRSFQVDRSRTKIFACQNPLQEGGGRKGLPKSFLNRFTQVHVDNLSPSDLLYILSSCNDQIPADVMQRMVDFNQKVYQQVVCDKTWAHRGAPWEFNLRDLSRWSSLIANDTCPDKNYCACKYAYLIYTERLRSTEDRQKMFNLFQQEFEKELYIPTRYFHISDNMLQIGHSVMNRRHSYYPSPSMDSIVIPSLLHPAESLIHALNMNWPCILTGPSGAGKSVLVHSLAALSGRRLRVLSMNSGMDAIELLGGYEQSDLAATAFELNDKIIGLLNQVCRKNLLATDFNKKAASTQTLMTVIENLQVFSSQLESNQCEADSDNLITNIQRQIETIRKFCLTANFDLAVQNQIKDILTKLGKLTLEHDTKGSYQWSDCVLVKALQDGDWLLIDGANFCSASVLDRLNALLEPNGVLTITERGVIDGSVPEVKPHSDFRLILAFDPLHGELSRAMRNRCVEIHLLYDAERSINPLKPAEYGLTNFEVMEIIKSKCLSKRELEMVLRSDCDKNLVKTAHFDDVLTRIRYGLIDDDKDCRLYDNLDPTVRSPSVRDFLFNPSWSLLLRQITVVCSFVVDIQCHSDDEVQEYISMVIRNFAGLCTSRDRNLREEVLEKLVAVYGPYLDVKGYSNLFSDLIRYLFSRFPNSNQSQFQYLPWDRRYTLQSVNNQDISSEEESAWDKAHLYVVYKLGKLKEDRCNLASTFKNKKKFLSSAFTFQLAKAFTMKKVMISDLPHSCLAYLLPLYRTWNSFVVDVLCDDNLLSFNFPQCQGFLVRISFIWKIFMTTTFNLSAFVMWYLLLKKEITSLSNGLGVASITSCVTLFDVIVNLDKSVNVDANCEKEYKLQNKVYRSIIKGFNVFIENEQQCLMASCLKFMLRDVSAYVTSVRREDAMSCMTWNDVLTILTEFVKVHFNLNFREMLPNYHGSSSSCDDMDVDDDNDGIQLVNFGSVKRLFSDLVKLCQSHGVGFSAKSRDLLKNLDVKSSCDESQEIVKSISSLNLSVSSKQLSPLYYFYFLLSQLHRFSHQYCLDKSDLKNILPRLTTLQFESCFDIACLAQSKNNDLSNRSSIVSQVLKWPQFESNQSSNDDEEKTGDSKKISNLLKPYLCQTAAEILYKSYSKRSSRVQSLDQLFLKTWDSARISLKDVAEKSRQLDEFGKCLWINATGSSLVSTDASSNLSLSSQLSNCIVGAVETFNHLLSFCLKFDERFSLIFNTSMTATFEQLKATLSDFIENRCLESESPILDCLNAVKLTLSSNCCDFSAKKSNSEWIESVCKTLSLCVKSLVDIVGILSLGNEQVFTQVERKERTLRCWKVCGNLWVWSGYLQFLFSAPRSSVDPVKSYQSKKDCYSAEVEQLVMDKLVRTFLCINMTGREYSSNNDKILYDFSHPHCQSLLDYLNFRREVLGKKYDEASYRPAGNQFLQLIKDCSSFLKTVCDSKLLEETLEKISSQKSNTLALKTEEKLQESYESFTRSLNDKYPAYLDFVQPITDAVLQIRFGLQLVRSSSLMLNSHHRQQAELSRFTASPICPEQFLILYMNGSYSADDVDWFVSLLKSMHSRSFGSSNDKIIADVLMCSLLRLRNRALRSTHCSTFFNDMVRLAEIVVVMWNKREKRREERAAERASMFKYKQRIHLMDDDDLKEKKEFKAMFCTFEKDVADLLKQHDNDVEFKDKEETSDDVDEEEEDEDLHLTSRAFDLAALIHTDVSKKLIKDESITITSVKSKTKSKSIKKEKPKDHVKPDVSSEFMLPLLLSHSTITSSKSLSSLYGAEMDHALLGKHLIACNKLNEVLSSQSSAETKKETMNVYVDSLPSEVSRCLDVLDHFRSTLTSNLLKEWPDHPVLTTILNVIDRISSFSVTFPLMKFVAGLEALLAAAQEWESNASRNVSLSKHLEAVSNLVIDWRKLELKSWFRLLDEARQKAADGMTKWWFYIYQLIEDCTDDTKKDKSSPLEVITSLQKFIESSTIGQFKARLDLLHAFYCHLVIKNKEKDPLARSLFNLKGYYGQFMEATEERIAFIRKPIETELKEFVKIAKWNDINFYALKESVKKTHQTLFKMTKKFTRALLEPMRAQVLNVSSPAFTSDYQNVQSAGLSIALKWKDVAASQFNRKKPPLSTCELTNLLQVCDINEQTDCTELRRLSTILIKLDKHCQSWTNDVNAFLPDLLVDFENCITNVVVNFKELRSLEPSTPLSKDEEERNKRLSEAKHIHARKRRALSDLFRLLRVIGLSYRKGIIWEKSCDPNQAMLTPTPRPNAQYPHRSPVRDLTNSTLADSHRYFFKMISRWTTLLAALRTPNKDIIGAGLDRLQGFASHVISVALLQRQHVTTLCESNRDLDALIENLETHVEKKDVNVAPCAEVTLKKLFLCRKMVDDWLESLLHFKELLSCAPKSSSEGVAVSNPLPPASLCCHGDLLWSDVISEVYKEIQRAEKMSSALSEKLQYYCFESGKLKPGILVLPDLLLLVNSTVTCLRDATTEFCNKMSSSLGNERLIESSSNNILTSSPLLYNIIEGRKTLLSQAEQIEQDQDQSLDDVSRDEVLGQLNDVLSQIMLAVQHLVKNNDGVEDASTTDEGLLEFHFLHHMHNRSSEYFQYLNVEKIHDDVMELMNKVRRFAINDQNSLVFNLVLHSLVPLLGEYLSLSRQTLLFLSIINRSTCKFAYILASIAAEVVQKGFCPPPEFEEEMADEKGEFKEVDDAGIGEGEGNKDVSEQIDEENQVEDRPDEEKEDQKDEIPPEDNAIEMSNDFDGNFQDDAPPDEENDENDNDEKELDKQMGDLGDEPETEKLDERMWGSDDEDDDDKNGDKDDKREEKGKGMDSEESELLAKDDKLKDEGGDEEDQGDQSEFNPNERDEDHEKEPEENAEPLDLPDDIDMDGGGEEEEKDTNEPEKEEENQETKELDEQDLPPDPEKESQDETVDGDDGKDDEQENGDEKPDDDNDGNHDNEAKNEDDEKQEEVNEDSHDDVKSDDNGDEDDEEMKEEESTEPVKQEDAEEEKKTEEEKEEDKEENEQGGQGTQLPMEEDEEEEDEKPREETKRSNRIETEDNIEQSETADEEVMKQAAEDGENRETSGMAPSSDINGEQSELAAPQSVQEKQQDRNQPRENDRKQGESDAKRSLGDAQDVLPKKLKLMDDMKEEEDGDEDDSEDRNENADTYQHMTDDVKHYDKQTRDAATEEQMKKQPIEMEEENDPDINVSDDDAEKENQSEVTYTEAKDVDDVEKLESKLVPIVDEELVMDDGKDDMMEDDKSYRVVNEEGEVRDLPSSSIHTNNLDWEPSSEFMSLTPEQVFSLRKEMEDHLKSVSAESEVEIEEAETMWHQYQSLTQPLSQQLSEQLRLILEPTRAAKLKGDYRTGKRLNMRKVIPYIASGFRKDKIWLRRSKPSKREYQIMVAVDDSSSMADNHTKQLAFESLAVISTALTTIEAGQLSVCRFGEETKLLHDFHQPFTDRSGASVLQQCTFKQEQTKIAKLLDTCVKFLKTAQTSYTSSADPRLSQLLLIISDGRGLYIEGKEKVEAAVRAAKDARVFLAFVILDNPAMKDSILDIKVPVFKENGKIDIRSYMSDFPFPFYVIIRNINSLPETLSEALRQWFEIVAGGD